MGGVHTRIHLFVCVDVVLTKNFNLLEIFVCLLLIYVLGPEKTIQAFFGLASRGKSTALRGKRRCPA